MCGCWHLNSGELCQTTIHFKHPIKCSFCSRVPYDEQTIGGYIISLFLQVIGGTSMILVIITVVVLCISVCWYIEAMLDDMRKLFDESDATTSAQRKKLYIKEAILYYLDIIRYELSHFN